jgi:hypothetical protein
VPNGLTGATHTHGQGQQTQDGHAVGVSVHQGLVDTHTGEVVDITRLGQTHNGVDEHVSVVGAGSADGQLSVSTMHGVSGLESDDSGPAELVEVEAHLRRGVWWHHVSWMHARGVGLSNNVHLESKKS